MSHVVLTGQNQHTAKAYEMLRSELLTRLPNGEHKIFSIVITHTEDGGRRAPERSCSFEDVRFLEINRQASDIPDTGLLELWPSDGVIIDVRTHPLVFTFGDGEVEPYPSSINSETGKVTIVRPFYYYSHKRKVSFRTIIISLKDSDDNQQEQMS